MSAFNKRLAPPRVFGLPVLAVIAGLIAITGLLSAVVLPGFMAIGALLFAAIALPTGAVIIRLGDDIVFVGSYWQAHKERRYAVSEALWL